MLELFHRDATGKAGGAHDELDSIYGKGISENDLKYLEYLTNEFHLNPRPAHWMLRWLAKKIQPTQEPIRR
jgi:hypothetical protein